jgi:hypothetical protein
MFLPLNFFVINFFVSLERRNVLARCHELASLLLQEIDDLDEVAKSTAFAGPALWMPLQDNAGAEIALVVSLFEGYEVRLVNGTFKVDDAGQDSAFETALCGGFGVSIEPDGKLSIRRQCSGGIGIDGVVGSAEHGEGDSEFLFAQRLHLAEHFELLAVTLMEFGDLPAVDFASRVQVPVIPKFDSATFVLPANPITEFTVGAVKVPASDPIRGFEFALGQQVGRELPAVGHERTSGAKVIKLQDYHWRIGGSGG